MNEGDEGAWVDQDRVANELLSGVPFACDQDAIGSEGFSDVHDYGSYGCQALDSPRLAPPVMSCDVVIFDATAERERLRKTETFERTARRHKAQIVALKNKLKTSTSKPTLHQQTRQNYIVALARNFAHGSCESAAHWSALLADTDS